MRPSGRSARSTRSPRSTTAALLGNILEQLSSRPDDRRWLLDHPDGWPQAIEESLRYEAPVEYMLRRATRNADIAGHQIPMGDEAALLFGSANRDERRFADPDRFDIRRPPSRHLAFGEGIHFCLGAALARLEAGVVLPLLLEHLGDYQILDGARRLQARILRGWAALPLAIGEPYAS